jgi:hypothetical protein
MPERVYAMQDRVQWSPVLGLWEPGTVIGVNEDGTVEIVLDGDGSRVVLDPARACLVTAVDLDPTAAEKLAVLTRRLDTEIETGISARHRHNKHHSSGLAVLGWTLGAKNRGAR